MAINSNPIPENTLIKQWTDCSVTVDSDGNHSVTEKWKGRFDHCQQVAMGLSASQTTSGGSGIPYSTFQSLGGTLSSAYSMPSAPTGRAWALKNANVEEIEAGTHGFLTLTWDAIATGGGGGGGGDDNIVRTETWNIDWQSETYDVYAYCANLSSDTTKANRANIEAVFNATQNLNHLKKDYMFVDELGNVKKLNPSEIAIYNKKAQGKGPLLHYPIISHTVGYSNVLSSQVDSVFGRETLVIPDQKISGKPTGCPFPLTTYQFLTEGTQVTQTISNASKKSSTIQFTTRWIGALSVDEQFYGENKWLLGQM